MHLSAVCVVGIALATSYSAAAADRTAIEGVDHYRVTEPLFEGIRVILNQRGEPYSAAYICGISGAAFRLGGPCPCAPTCEAAMSSQDLVKLLGYEYEWLSYLPPGEGVDDASHPELGETMEQRVPGVIERVKDEVRKGRPVLVWTAFTPYEFDVVCGFDEEKAELIGRGPYSGAAEYASAPQNTALKGADVGMGAMIIGQKSGAFDARAAEIAALREAVLHAHGASRSLGGAMAVGLDCYDLMIAAYRNEGHYLISKRPDTRYTLMIAASTHGAAADFLRELAPKYPDARGHLEAAAEHVAAEAASLRRFNELCRGGELEGADGAARAAGLLAQARAMYALGMAEIARALGRIAPHETPLNPGAIRDVTQGPEAFC